MGRGIEVHLVLGGLETSLGQAPGIGSSWGKAKRQKVESSEGFGTDTDGLRGDRLAPMLKSDSPLVSCLKPSIPHGKVTGEESAVVILFYSIHLLCLYFQCLGWCVT